MGNIEIFVVTTIAIVSIATIHMWFKYAAGYRK